MELLHICEEIIEIPDSAEGELIECGSWMGGSTAKLSLAVAVTKRLLIVCDSFKGLPAVMATDHVESKEAFQVGDFAAPLAQVRENVTRFGCIRVVEFLPGWYEESLETLGTKRVVCAFLDVDLQASIKSCILALWKRMEPGSKIFVHDVDRSALVAPFQDKAWWLSNIGSPVPRFYGAVSGLSRQKPLLGYTEKV